MVGLLLQAASRRAGGRRLRQRELLGLRLGRRTRGFGIGPLATLLFGLFLNGAAALAIEGAVRIGQRIEAERHGWIVVDDGFAREAHRLAGEARSEGWSTAVTLATTEADLSREAAVQARERGVDAAALRQLYETAVLGRQARRFVGETRATPGVGRLGWTGLPAMLGSLVLLLWSAMLVAQGEGPELDVQRRRHPMWEWLLAHPVRPAAVFFAEMLSPIAANPLFWTAPLVPAALYGIRFGEVGFVVGGLLVGPLVVVSAACVGKALEIAVLLRASARMRGPLIGILGWLGYATGAGLFALVLGKERVPTVAARLLAPLADLPWPWLGLLLGRWEGLGPGLDRQLWIGVAGCWAIGGLAIAVAIVAAARATGEGLVGGGRTREAAPKRARSRPRFGRNALLHKEALWFVRDRSALVQVVLVPLTIAGVQLFNLRGVVAEARGAWNGIAGTAILLGTYFVAVVGPRSLASEGGALWIAMGWPTGLEDLLAAKARLWSWLSCVPVWAGLLYGVWAFPNRWWAIALVAVGWWAFSRSLAGKAVTLAQVDKPSGEVERVPSGRRWAAQSGTTTFAFGVLSAQWQLAVVGIVFSTMAEAAMWQNFRTRLPYLMDPWSEPAPKAPSLTHAMVAIGVLVELTVALVAVGRLLFDTSVTAFAATLAIAGSAAAVSAGVAWFLRGRGVALSSVWRWREVRGPGLARSLAIAAGLGIGLGVVGCGWIELLRRIPWSAELLRKAAAVPVPFAHAHAATAVAAVLVAPWAEEFLFRGLLYRALERDWSRRRAVLGSAAFFASYHPALAWAPVGLLGAVNAWLFRRTGHLVAPVLTHMVYNAIVVSWSFGWIGGVGVS